jgi:crotonobetainyl-CoA:carnitine CoA-transferase CaiB-like acyl-CoA transferase
MLSPVSTIEDICHNRQLKERGFWVDVLHHELSDTLRYPGPWAKLTETPLARWEKAPRIGEHNDEIYRDELSMSPNELEYLRRSGVI